MLEEKFLLDANAFITPYRLYYAFDLAPSYWQKISVCTQSGRLVLLDMVKDEVDKGKDASGKEKDELAKWLDGQENFVFCNHVDTKIILCYQDVLEFVKSSGFYKKEALDDWARETVADPWLIAAAMANGYTIITTEVSAGSLSTRSPSKSAKIPDVANYFGVNTGNPFYMMRQLGIRI